MRELNCSLCGKKFTAKAGNVKYCSPECKEEGKQQRRKEWEERTDYKEKQRQIMKVYRGKVTEEERQAAKKIKEQQTLERQEEDERQSKERQAELRKKAAAGDPFARMNLAEPNSKEYWEAYKQYEIEYAASWGRESTRTVNDISVHDPCFGRKVVEAIKELGIIRTRL